MSVSQISQEIRVFVEGSEESQKVKIEHVEIQVVPSANDEAVQKTRPPEKLLGKITIRKSEVKELWERLGEVLKRGAASYKGVPQIVIHSKRPRDEGVDLSLENEEASASLQDITRRAAQRAAAKPDAPRAIASPPAPAKDNMTMQPRTKPGMRRLKKAPPSGNEPTPVQEASND